MYCRRSFHSFLPLMKKWKKLWTSCSRDFRTLPLSKKIFHPPGVDSLGIFTIHTSSPDKWFWQESAKHLVLFVSLFKLKLAKLYIQGLKQSTFLNFTHLNFIKVCDILVFNFGLEAFLTDNKRSTVKKSFRSDSCWFFYPQKG